MPTLYIKPARKDGKHPVRFCFENGVKINKLLTSDQLTAEMIKPSNDIRRGI